MGGGSRGPSPEETALQQQQLDLERQRFALEQQAAEASTRELSLLQQQLSEQSILQQEQTSLLSQLNQESAVQQQDYAALLLRQQTEETRAAELAKVESIRASSSQAKQTERANFGLLRNLSYNL